ncbi:MAG: aminotransferase class III-fold pyridoxal phosphate-dependent enzyme, partial [Gammaproteobacteria bacterium]|nr:aminotransferase class III-fold pyridoxal phosphate-dependent enzyme [Gammaproteobacteria bacterium]
MNIHANNTAFEPDKYGADVPALITGYEPYPLLIRRGRGYSLITEDGDTYLDFYGGHCVCATGHSHPDVVKAIAAQADELLFYSTAANLPVRERAARALVNFAPADLASVFFCNSGAEANENALKIALKITGRKKLLAFNGGFHGRSLLALSVTDAPKLKNSYESFLAPAEFLPFGDADALDHVDFKEFAAVIVEPLQSMAGVKTAPAAWFKKIKAKCAAADALLIFDEIQTGFGRLGTPFAADYLSVQPDMITCAKGMASGMPMGAVLMTAEVAAELKTGDVGSTFGGGPLACAALLATLGVIKKEKLMANAAAMGEKIIQGLKGGAVKQVSGRGLLLGLNAGSRAFELKK